MHYKQSFNFFFNFHFMTERIFLGRYILIYKRVAEVVLLRTHCFQRIAVKSIYSIFLIAINNLLKEIEKPFI